MPATVLQGFLLDVPNEPGALHRITSRLAAEGVNIQGIGGMATETLGRIGLVTENTLATREVLRDVGANVRPVEYLAVTTADRPGELDRYLTKLSDAGLNVVCLLTLIAREPTLAFAVDDPVKARDVMRNL